MTTIIAWLAVDQRQPSALYFASDSRISWNDSTNWDSGRKVFASRTTADIFGFVGEVLFPTQILGSITDLLGDRALFRMPTSSAERHTAFCEIIRYAHERRQNAPEEDFTIFHGARDGELMEAKFNVWTLSYSKKAKWKHSELELSEEHSKIVFAEGSGGSVVTKMDEEWQKSPAKRTSRAVFSAFCDALAAREDARSGGAPQLVGLYRKRDGLNFGVYAGGRPYIHGLAAAKHVQRSAFKWHNELFENVDPATGGLQTGAQQHRRETPR